MKKILLLLITAFSFQVSSQGAEESLYLELNKHCELRNTLEILLNPHDYDYDFETTHNKFNTIKSRHSDLSDETINNLINSSTEKLLIRLSTVNNEIKSLRKKLDEPLQNLFHSDSDNE